MGAFTKDMNIGQLVFLIELRHLERQIVADADGMDAVL